MRRRRRTESKASGGQETFRSHTSPGRGSPSSQWPGTNKSLEIPRGTSYSPCTQAETQAKTHQCAFLSSKGQADKGDRLAQNQGGHKVRHTLLYMHCGSCRRHRRKEFSLVPQKTILTLLTLLNHWYSLLVSDVPTKCIQTCTDILSLSLSLPSGLGTPTDKQATDLEREAD